jgi:energy-converting hydrogenase Eha subunit H
MSSLGGNPFYILEFGDELVYLSPYTVTLFLFALVFTLFAIRK